MDTKRNVSRIWPIASLLFLLAYGLAYWQGISLFYYMPIKVEFILGPDKPTNGPAMGWYGLISLATLVALTAPLVAAATKGFKFNIWKGVFWLLPIIILIQVIIHEWHWFIK